MFLAFLVVALSAHAHALHGPTLGGVRVQHVPPRVSIAARAELATEQQPPSAELQRAIAEKRRTLDAGFVKIAAPAFVQFAAEPLARLIDTAYLGRLGPAALGGAGAAVAAQYAFAKLYNDPLLRTTISLVAAQEGEPEDPTALRRAVSASLLLALVVGLAQGAILGFLAGPLLTLGCVPPTSTMRASALGYLRVCAIGSPLTTLWLAVNGIFRGLGDTATPLLWALVFSGLNALLDPIFIFKFGFGASGAAAGTALAQLIALLPLLLALQRKMDGVGPASSASPTSPPTGADVRMRAPIVGLFLPPGGLSSLRTTLTSYASAGSLVMLRSLGKISAYSVCAREAARLGAVASAAHNLCFQLGVATTQLCESLAIAMQTLLARELGGGGARGRDGRDGRDRALRAAASRHVVSRGLGVGALAAGALSLTTLFNRRRVVNGLTTIPEVRAAAAGVMPLVMLCQALKGLAYPVSGALMGALDWRASAAAMWSAQISCLVAIGVWSRGGARALTLNRLWASLAILFAVQIGAGLLRIASGRGPWAVLLDTEEGDDEALGESAGSAAPADSGAEKP